MHEHARGVQHAAELRPPRRLELGERPLDEVAGVGAGPDLLARALERRSRGLERRRARLAARAARRGAARRRRAGREASSKPSVSRDACLTIGVLRRIRLAVTAVILRRRRHGGHRRRRPRRVLRRPAAAGRHGARGAPDAARHASSSTAGASPSRPGACSAIYRGATERAVQEAGRHSFLTRVQALADPSPPAIEVDPALIVRPGELSGSPTSSRPSCSSRHRRRSSCAAPSLTSCRAPGPGHRPTRAPPRPARCGARRRRASSRRRCVDVAVELDTAAAEEAAETARARRLGAGGAALRRPRRRRARAASSSRSCSVFTPADDRFVVTFDAERLARAVQPSVARVAPPGEERALRRRGPQRPHRPVAPRPRREPEADARRRSPPPRTRPTRTAALTLRETRADRTTARGRGARHPRAHLHLHDRDGRLVVEPDPQRPPDGGLRRRHDHRARRLLLVQRPRRPAHGRARLPRGPDDRRLAARCRRSAAASARRRRRSSTTRSSSGCRSSAATTTASTSRTTRWAATRRSRGAGPTSSSGTT